MKNVHQCVVVIFVLVFLSIANQPSAVAAIDVEMILNDGGFVSFDHFKAELYLNNHDVAVPDAWIFGILEIAGDYYYWPDFQTDVNYQELTIEPGEAYLTFLEFDFPDIDPVIPFGPMNFWGAWYVDFDHYGYDVKEFWLDTDHKWTPTPIFTPTPNFTAPPTSTNTDIPTNTPTFTPVPPTPTFTPTVTPTPAATNTPGEFEPGDLYSDDPIVGNMRYIPATGPGGFLQGSPEDEPCNDSDEYPQFTHILTRSVAVMETELTSQMWWDLQALQPDLPDDPTNACYGAGATNPAQNYTWYESVLFANLLSLANGFTRCYYSDAEFTIPIDVTNYTVGPFYCDFDADGYRLPTEGEWEYFTRAGTTGPFSFEEPNYTADTCGSPYCVSGEFPVLEQYAVYCANDNGESEPVGSKLGNPWNLKDVHGNVYEWCWDWLANYPTGTETDYAGAETGSVRVIRGGSWNDYAQYCRSAVRNYSSPEYRHGLLGARFLRVAP